MVALRVTEIKNENIIIRLNEKDFVKYNTLGGFFSCTTTIKGC